MGHARGYLLAFAVTCACAQGYRAPSRARADELARSCVASSQRSSASIVSASGEGHTRAVWITPGETLCLFVVGAPETRAQVGTLERASSDQVVSVELAVDANRSVLRIRNGLGRELRYRVGIVEGGELRETYVLPAPPRSETTESWGHALAALALYDIQLGPYGPEGEPYRGMKRRPPLDEWPWDNAFSIGVLAGATWNSLDSINRDLRRHGLGPQSDLQPLLGIGFEYEARALALELEFLGGPPRASAPGSPDLNQLVLVLQGGYRLVATRAVTLAPMLGFGIGSISIDTNPDDPELSTPKLDELPGDADIERTIPWFIVSAGINYRLPLTSGRESLLLGVRGGYMLQLGQSDWSAADGTDRYELPGGPAVEASGPYMRLLLGYTE